MHATYGFDEVDIEEKPSCWWCTDGANEDERPCCPECEYLDRKNAQSYVVAGLVEAITRTTNLLAVYHSEGVRGDRRAAECEAQIAEYNRQIELVLSGAA